MQKVKISFGNNKKIVRSEIVENGNGIEFCIVSGFKPGTKEFEKLFPIIPIEEISLQEDFMKYEPENSTEKRIKESIKEAKEMEMKNFRKPCMDPSFAADGETIIYCAGEKPAVGKSEFWWEENAKKFMPEKNSRIINDLEKDVSLGVLIRCLVKENHNVRDAWKIVCSDSEDDKYSIKTGKKHIGVWCDLYGEIWKIVKKRNTSIFLGYAGCGLHQRALASNCILGHNTYYYEAVGEIVIDE